MKVSILTATYNRAEMLKKLYESLKKNLKYKLNIEWIIVDDGSTDKTKSVVAEFIEENKILIKYCYQKNQGKMVAINEAVKFSTGELIMDCDSDDYLTEDALEILSNTAKELEKNPNLYGLCFLKKEDNGQISGNKFKMNNLPTTMFDLYFKDDIQGEKVLVFNAQIRKKYMHQLENGEKFVTEARMYHKMDEKYKILCINEALQVGSYREDGYTKNIKKTFMESPFGYYKYFMEILQKDMKGVLFNKRMYVIKHYILFGVLTGKKFDSKIINNISNKILYTCLYLPGKIKSEKFKNS